MRTPRGLLLVALLAWATPTYAQLPTSSVRGTVTDAQSAILPGATTDLIADLIPGIVL